MATNKSPQIRTVSVNGSIKTPIYPSKHCNNFKVFNYAAELLYVYSDPTDDTTRIEVDIRNEVPLDFPSDKNTPTPRYDPQVPVFYAMLASVTVGDLKTISQ